jgi:hypothetical protein
MTLLRNVLNRLLRRKPKLTAQPKDDASIYPMF